MAQQLKSTFDSIKETMEIIQGKYSPIVRLINF